MRYEVEIAGQHFAVDLSEPPGLGARSIRLTLGQESFSAEILDPGPPCLLTIDGRVFEVCLRRHPSHTEAECRGNNANVRSAHEQVLSTANAAAASGERHIKSPIPGRVLRVLVDDGDLVAQGQSLVVVEAMKMENELFAPAAGTVVSISARPGQTVEASTTLLIVRS